MMIICTALLIFVTFIWFSNTTVIYEYASIFEKTPNSISLENESGRKVSVSTSLNISDLIVVGEKYWVRYEKKRWQSPSLESIEH
ncbi:hypothetical protein GCM10010911_62660 [Paenibacillus nasutitermitis]|uniref:Uncharacterized protein n=1 Tax=Paenibacillus nasutitermitis TaxID=1652958 RepID=A0A916ZFT6_9BACL|nr:hypothetical protein GCM10010911_62660 [Paenibacillus nasutitermitis]